MYEDLIKRLKAECTLPYTSIQLMREAADAIAELQERVATSEAIIKRQSDIIQAKDRDLQRTIDAKRKHDHNKRTT